MQEFDNFIQACIDRYAACEKCADNCVHGHYCKQVSCGESNCGACLNHIQWGKGLFTYECRKITFHYVLKYFYRFASEIDYLMQTISLGNGQEQDFVVYSLGCGPGSEVFGLVDSIQKKFPNLNLKYEGFDLNPIWDEVQKLNKYEFLDSNHTINFHCENLFVANILYDKINMLVLNYLLSDIVKFCNLDQRRKFVDEIVDFIVSNGVKSIFFNDINYFGGDAPLDSGLQMMLSIIEKIKVYGCSVSLHNYHFLRDKRLGNIKWKLHPSDKLLFTVNPCNPVSYNHVCNSKQVFCYIRY